MPPQAICTARAESRGLSAGGWASMRARVPRCAQGAAGRAVARPPLRLRTPPGRRCGCGAQRGSRHAATCPRPLAEVRSLHVTGAGARWTLACACVCGGGGA
eukprot:366052-Chlamydomonas_euryale.AAC.2